ncbi:MAG TPA: DUF748 domain-containing protein [Desulfobacterales bacterium]|nr:DUF748 domain-containing protein [Desulfobacterales bacterium]
MPTERQDRATMDRLKRILRSKRFLVPVGLLIAYTLAGFFLVPALVRHYVPRVLDETLHRPAAIGEVRFNPFVFTLEANDFSLSEPDGSAIAGFKRFFVDFELQSLFNWAWTFRTVTLEAPTVNAIVAKDGVLNLARLVPAGPEPAPPPAAPEPLPRLIVEEVRIDQAEIAFTDRRQSDPAAIVLKPLDLGVKHLSTLPREEGDKTITAVTRDGEALRWTGHIRLNPLVSKGRFDGEKLKVATLWKFARDALNLEPPSGVLALGADYAIDLSGAEPEVRLANLGATVTGLSLRLRGAEAAFLELPDVRVEGVGFDLARRTADVTRIAVKGGRARLKVDESGTLNVEGVVKPAPSAASPKAAQPEPGPAWKVSLKEFALDGLAADYEDTSREPGLKAGIETVGVKLKANAEAGAGPVSVAVSDIAVALKRVQAGLAGTAETPLQIESVALEGGAYDLEANALSLERVAVAGGTLDVRRQADGAINLQLLFAPPRKGAIAREVSEAAAAGHPFGFVVKTVAVSGLQASVSDLSVRPGGPILNLRDIAVGLENVDGKSPMTFDAAAAVAEGGRLKAAGSLAPQGPALEAQLQVADLVLPTFQPYVDQALSARLTSGTFSLKGALRHGGKPGSAQTAFQGGFKLDGLRLLETGGSDTLVGWKSVQTDQLTLDLEPNRLEIGDLKVVGPVGKFIVEKDRSINLVKVVKVHKEAKPAASPPPPADPFPYRVRRVLVSEGRVDFADLSLIMPFGTRVHELKGVVAGVSSVRNSRAQVKLDGRVDDYGTAKVDGELNASDPKAFTRIDVAFRNVEMSRLTPYSGEFAGRKIESGKLTVDLKYRIDKSQLAGDNRLVVDRLTLGEKVQSPDAVDLPLDLAVALLSDANGVIDLGLPVSGNLDAPEFSYGALVWKAFTNLLTKIVTSPFRALGALLPGGGEDGFDAVAFEPGRPELTPPEKEKLAQLAGALQKRPQLRLSVQGRYTLESDRAELQALAVRRALAARLGRAPEAADDPVDTSGPETAKAVEALFVERLGAEALKALRTEQAAAADKARREAAAAAKPGTAAPPVAEDPGRWVKELLGRIEKAQPVDDAALARLADERAAAVVAEVRDVGLIAPERLATLPPAAMEKTDGPVTAPLKLEAN